jgi:hypothetical protein
VELADRLDVWVREGLITRAEADAIAAFESRPGAMGARDDAMTTAVRAPAAQASASEALAYLGAALAIAAAGTLLGRIWDELSTPARVAIPAFVAATLLVVGWRLRGTGSPPMERLSHIAWFLSSIALGWMAAIVVSDGLGLAERATYVAIGASLVISAGILYVLRPATLEQLAVLAGTMFLAIGLGWGSSSAIGWLFWIVGVAWIVLGARRLLVEAPPALGMGAVVVLVGCVLIATAGGDVGSWVSIVSSAGLIGAGVGLRSQSMLVVGAIGLFFSTIAVVQRYVEGSAGIAAGLLVAAGVVLAVAFVVSRFEPTTWRRRPASEAQANR